MDRKKLYLSTIDPAAGTIAEKYGLGVEIAEYCTAWNLDDHFSATDAQVRQEIRGVERRMFHGPFNELFPCAIDPQARALAARRYTQAMALAKQYDARGIVIHGGFQPFAYYRSWYVEQSILFWKSFLRDAPGGLTIFLENVLEPEPEDLLDIVRGVGDPRLRLCLDVGHVNAYSRIPVEAWLKTLSPFLSHFHIHNNDGSRDTHSPLYEGTIPMEELLRKAEELCPEATYTLELTQSEASVCWLLDT